MSDDWSIRWDVQMKAVTCKNFYSTLFHETDFFYKISDISGFNSQSWNVIIYDFFLKVDNYILL